MGYEDQGVYSRAISYWNLLLPLLQDEKSTNEVQKLIRQAKSKAGINTADSSASDVIKTEKKTTTSLKVSVNIDKTKLKDVSMTDTVFIFAKATSGPPMPLAVVRKQVKDLPLDVTLDDSMAMIPSMKISNFKEVQIVARISKSGSPKAQSGDFQSEPQVVAADNKQQIALIINKLVP
jgi:cytochrome c-type biogenesis protein CcmH